MKPQCRSAARVVLCAVPSDLLKANIKPPYDTDPARRAQVAQTRAKASF